MLTLKRPPQQKKIDISNTSNNTADSYVVTIKIKAKLEGLTNESEATYVTLGIE